MPRTFVIGDVHGCADELERLLALLAPRRADEIVFVGDLVNKGPASIEVLAIARELGAKAVLGNHDDLVLRAARARRTDGEMDEFPEPVRKIVKRLDRDDERWLRALPLFHRLPDHRAIVVHGGMLPGIVPEKQTRLHLLTMRSVRDDGTGSKRIDDGRPWGAVWNGRTHAIFGHDAMRGLQLYPKATGLDTGCVYGGRLTALVLPGHHIVSVKAKREYATPGRSMQKTLHVKRRPPSRVARPVR